MSTSPISHHITVELHASGEGWKPTCRRRGGWEVSWAPVGAFYNPDMMLGRQNWIELKGRWRNARRRSDFPKPCRTVEPNDVSSVVDAVFLLSVAVAFCWWGYPSVTIGNPLHAERHTTAYSSFGICELLSSFVFVDRVIAIIAIAETVHIMSVSCFLLIERFVC